MPSFSWVCRRRYLALCRAASVLLSHFSSVGGHQSRRRFTLMSVRRRSVYATPLRQPARLPPQPLFASLVRQRRFVFAYEAESHFSEPNFKTLLIIFRFPRDISLHCFPSGRHLAAEPTPATRHHTCRAILFLQPRRFDIGFHRILTISFQHGRLRQVSDYR